ncbi:MAG: GTP-binding protein, partial [Planctomycetota bacterium]
MAKHTTEDIRNVAIAGHGTSGKTTLAEAFLLAAKVTKRLGSVADGSTIGDFDEHERELHRTIDSSPMFFPWKGKHINLIDTPGYPDCVGEAISGLSAADAALIAIDATAGVKVNTRTMWRHAADLGLPRAIVVTRADGEHANWDKRYTEMQEFFGENCVPFTLA